MPALPRNGAALDGTINELVTHAVTFGEGLHNNRRRFPRDACLSHAWCGIDINGLIILGLGRLGLVHGIFAAACIAVRTGATSRAVISMALTARPESRAHQPGGTRRSG